MVQAKQQLSPAGQARAQIIDLASKMRGPNKRALTSFVTGLKDELSADGIKEKSAVFLRARAREINNSFFARFRKKTFSECLRVANQIQISLPAEHPRDFRHTPVLTDKNPKLMEELGIRR